MSISMTSWLCALSLLSSLALSTSHWWSMSQMLTLGAKIMCDNIAGLVNFQRQVCRENPDVIVSIGKGAKLGVEECQQQLKDQRWNCSIAARNVRVFGRVMRKASRESAFVHAITSAGVVHEVTRACSQGELKDCTCDTNHNMTSEEGFEWGGCSDNIAYGLRIAKLFVDSVEQDRDARAKMNLHNNFVGRRPQNATPSQESKPTPKVLKTPKAPINTCFYRRKANWTDGLGGTPAVQSHTILRCKCHGISGSCGYKTCWKMMDSFGVVGSYLRDKYHNGVLVTVDQSGSELVLPEGRSLLKPFRDDLVFLEDSPDYCVSNSNTGSLGTTGRVCNKTTSGHGSCGILCCGRGFNTIQIEEEYQCGCKFNWCCYVKCSTCRRTVDRHMCKPPNKDISTSNGANPEMSETNSGTNIDNQNRTPYQKSG